LSILEKMAAAIRPPENDLQRIDARQQAQAAASPDDWLSLVLAHHRDLEAGFAAVKSAGNATARITAQKKLGILLTGHAIAEEGAIYPALADHGEKLHADTGYEEQARVKVQMAALEQLDPMSEDYLTRLDQIHRAVAHHMYQEEGSWFLALKEKAAADVQAAITFRYKEEYQRYVGSDAP